jgi:hypothetical protein
MDNFWNINNPMGLVVMGILGIFVLAYFLFKYIGLGIVIRFDNLKTASYQFVYIAIMTIIVVAIMNLIMQIPSVNDYIVAHNTDNFTELSIGRMWYIFNNTAAQSVNEASFAQIVSNWGQYVWWGLAQELLFLGYWCTLLTKIFKNKYVIGLLSGMCFAFIHFPSWPLMIFTIMAGLFWGIAWQRNDARNLFVLGASHGFGGSLLAKFIPITMSVGPSHMG